MSIFRVDEIQYLITHHDQPCVSLYMPTHRSGRDIEQDPIRFKNLLKQAEAGLTEAGYRTSEARQILEGPRQFLDDGSFWHHQSDGLAMFVCPDGLRHYRLSATLPELCVVGDRFHIKPLVPLITNDGRFYVLAISKERVRVLEGTRDSIVELEPAGLPDGLVDALQIDLPERQMKFYAGGSTRGGRRDAVYSGAGESEPDPKDALRRYFRQVDHGLRDLLTDQQAPLVLAGVEYMFPLYRDVSGYNQLMEEGIPGNPEKVTSNELHVRAWAIVQPYFEREQREAAARYGSLAAMESPLVSDTFAAVVPAAHHGRIHVLFVPIGVRQYGRYDATDDSVTLVDQPEREDQELYDLAVMSVLANRGRVFAVAPGKMPGAGPMAAVLRY